MIPQALLNNADILYRIDPELLEIDGMQIMHRIVKKDGSVFTDFQGTDVTFYNESNILEYEWGLGKVRDETHNNQVVFIAGSKGGVSWGNLLDNLYPLAHSHPFNFRQHITYYEENKTDHIKNGIPFNLINGINKYQWASERLKVFPSCGDIVFCANYCTQRHTVFTPFVVVAHPTGELWVCNPNASENFKNIPRLRFEISNALALPDKQYQCKLVASWKDPFVPQWENDKIFADEKQGLTSGVMIGKIVNHYADQKNCCILL